VTKNHYETDDTASKTHKRFYLPHVTISGLQRKHISITASVRGHPDLRTSITLIYSSGDRE